MDETTIVIADDHLLFADGLEQIVHSIEGFRVIGKVRDGKQLLQKLNVAVPDIILLDVNMPFLSGLEAGEKIRQRYPDVKIIFISMYYNLQLKEQARQLGASGFIMKDVTAPLLKEVILQVRAGVAVFLPPANYKQPADADVGGDPFLLQYKVSPREMDIIRLIKEGNSTKQIAAVLELSIYTVETHRKNINRKLKVQSAAELVALMHKFHT